MSRKKRPQRVPLFLTDRALGDLRDVEQYSVQQWGRKVADKYLDDLAAALDHLSENHDLLRCDPGFPTTFCFYRVRKHFLVCDYDGRRIIVLTVIHTSMDISARLAELEPRLAAEVEFLHNKLHGPRQAD